MKQAKGTGSFRKRVLIGALLGAGFSVLGLAPWEALFGIDGPVLLTLIPNALGMALLFGWFFGSTALSQWDEQAPARERIPAQKEAEVRAPYKRAA